jgi:serine protease Do
VEDEDWDDGAPTVSGPPAPPHERTWRHPSELGGRPLGAPQVSAQRSSRPVVGLAAAVVLIAATASIAVSRSGGEPSATADPPITSSDPVGNEAGTSGVRAAAPTSSVLDEPPRTTRVDQVVSTGLPEAPAVVSFVGSSARALPLSDDGVLVTTAVAVASGGTSFDVMLADGRRTTAVLVATGRGLAILRLDPNDLLTSVPLPSDTSPPAAGSWVTVFGDVTRRAVVVETSDGLALAGIDPDDSLVEGAPVVDAQGAIVGLCSRSAGRAILIPTSPAQEVRATATPWIGIAGNPPGDTSGPRGNAGVIVLDVIAGGPAAAAGIVPSDVVLDFDGRPVRTILQLAELVSATDVDTTVIVGIERDGVRLDVPITVGARPFAT